MELSPLFFLLILIIILLFHCSKSSKVEICSTFSCNPHRQDTIQFPFHVPGNQSSWCGYPGFDLTCGTTGQTYLNISSKPLIVQGIYYQDQVLFVSDPNSCIAKHVLTQNLTSTPYSYIYGVDTPTYTFLNCSGTNITKLDPNQLPTGTSVVGCLSGGDHTVMTTFERRSEEKLVRDMKCKVIRRVNAAFWWPGIEEGYYYPEDMSDVILLLTWGVPNCAHCVLAGGSCAFSNHSALSVACFFPHSAGLPRSVKYGLIIGLGVPAILGMIGLTYYAGNKVRNRNQNRQRYTNTELSPAIFPQPMILTFGLDRPTIESYPKTTLGESKRLPKSSDINCPICLSEYQPKETLRSIPECNHYFHADCIDEWLRMNATCPLCRKSPHQQLYETAGR